MNMYVVSLFFVCKFLSLHLTYKMILTYYNDKVAQLNLLIVYCWRVNREPNRACARYSFISLFLFRISDHLCMHQNFVLISAI